MIQFTKPQNLNGAQLITELNAAGILVNQEPLIDGNGDFWLDIDASDKSKAESIVATHNGIVMPEEVSIEEKLASVGLNLQDLKTALGL